METNVRGSAILANSDNHRGGLFILWLGLGGQLRRRMHPHLDFPYSALSRVNNASPCRTLVAPADTTRRYPKRIRNQTLNRVGAPRRKGRLNNFQGNQDGDAKYQIVNDPIRLCRRLRD
jgi:hypothetical protein